MKSKNLSFLQYIFVGSFILFKFCDCLHKSEEYGPTNGVEGEQRLMKKLKSSIPTMWPPVDMVNRTVFIYVDLFKIQEVDEKVRISFINSNCVSILFDTCKKPETQKR